MKPAFSCEITYQCDIFSVSKRAAFMPMLDAVVMNMRGEDIGVSERFLVDTGAVASVLNRKYENLLSKEAQVDTLMVQYGAGSPRRLPVYDLKLKIKSIEPISLKMAFDNELKTTSILGNVDFIDKFRSVAIVKDRRKVHFFLKSPIPKVIS